MTFYYNKGSYLLKICLKNWTAIIAS
jgi:hypothetical protein